MVYEVLLIPKLTDSDGTGLSGQILYEEGIIKLEEESTPRRQLLVLWHEVVHGIADLYGLKLDEQDVATLATATFSAFEENPIFAAKWLTNGD